MYMFIYIYISSIILESTSQVFRTEQFTQLSHSVSKPNTGWNSERLRNTVEEVETISNRRFGVSSTNWLFRDKGNI